jgi:hypothetical protein
MVDGNRLEVERIRNLVSGFGWEVIKEEVTDDDIILVMKKPRVVKTENMGAGPG